MDIVQLKAYAKINLSLDVAGRLPNRYHLVDMVMQTVDLYDSLSFTKTSGEIILSSDSVELPMDENNLIYKAIKAMQEQYGIAQGVKVHLQKQIPIAAGMAGGSTDAAATLKAVNQLFSLGAADAKLCEIGAGLGADIPYCIIGGTVRAQGIGEKLTVMKDCPRLNLLLAKPAEGVSTKEVYTAFDSLTEVFHPDVEGMKAAIEAGDISRIAGLLGNGLEQVTIAKCPVIGEIKKRMSECGALGCLMSGSGPTVFGIFENQTMLQDAYEVIKQAGIAKDVLMTHTIQPYA